MTMEKMGIARSPREQTRILTIGFATPSEEGRSLIKHSKEMLYVIDC